jgi:hypothetical protein
MAYHLVAVLLSPLLLALLAAVVSALWPVRLAPWPLLLPAWVLAAMTFALIPHRGDLAGPVLEWCRPDVPGIVLSALAMPLAALLVAADRGRSPRAARLLASPWRFALLQASVAGVGLVPLPCVLASTAMLAPWSWRHARAPLWLGLAGTAACVAWPWPDVVDALAAVAALALAVLLRPTTRGERAWQLAAFALAGLAAWRATT